MTQLIISTNTPEDMQKILSLARKNRIPFQFSKLNNDMDKEISALTGYETWILPGNQVSEQELEQYLAVIDDQKGGLTTEELEEELNKWRKER